MFYMYSIKSVEEFLFRVRKTYISMRDEQRVIIAGFQIVVTCISVTCKPVVGIPQAKLSNTILLCSGKAGVSISTSTCMFK